MSLIIVQGAVCAVSAMPVVALWTLLLPLTSQSLPRLLLVSALIAPSYVLFALCLMVVSPIALRVAGWHSPPDANMRIANMEWRLLAWARYLASLQLVRVISGSLLRGTPLWTAYLRLSGARLGKRVYINSLSVSDYNLIECGDDVVIGANVHLSGHTVEAGIVKTGRVRLGNNVTIGLAAVIEIDVEIGSNCQIGALSFVPKHTKLAGNAVYVGAPAAPLS